MVCCGGDWGADGDDARAEFNADGHVVVLDETAFAETDGEGGFTGAAVADADEFCDVIPWLGHWVVEEGGIVEEKGWEGIFQASLHGSFCSRYDSHLSR